MYVENAAQAHLQAADRLEAGSPVCGRAYFLSQGEPVELLGLDQPAAGVGGSAAGGAESSRWLRLGGSVGSSKRCIGLLRREVEPRMTRFLAAQLGRSHYFDTRRAREDFGYAPRISTEEGMQRLANSWLNR